MTAQAEREKKSETAEPAKKTEKVDFKMVTFWVREGVRRGHNEREGDAKASRFTYVPNASPFVRGVYNLRGEIISVIDLRIFFHLPAERKEEEALESLIILKIDEHVFGVIVNAIDKVVGITFASIRLRTPFSAISTAYIKGIVESGGKLYIILDVEKIFAPERPEEAPKAGALDRHASETLAGGGIAGRRWRRRGLFHQRLWRPCGAST